MGRSDRSGTCLLPTKVSEIGNAKVTSIHRRYPMLCKEKQEPSLWQINAHWTLETACIWPCISKVFTLPLPGSYFNKIAMYAMIIYKDVHCSIMYISKKYGYEYLYIGMCLLEDAAHMCGPVGFLNFTPKSYKLTCPVTGHVAT